MQWAVIFLISFQDLERQMAECTCKIENLLIPLLTILQVTMPHQVAEEDGNIPADSAV